MGRRSATLARFYDPTGSCYGLPTYPWGWARGLSPELAARGLRPGGQEPVAQLMWRSRRATTPDGVRTALLYRVDLARPKRTPTPAQHHALQRALRARRTCRVERGGCGRVREYVLPTRFGLCLDCIAPEDLEPLR
ncbi:RRQRL motif-containing zinc-binding protein [Actinomadura kijaniata]|uniref:RRQRL motif-containing zinc-binding protein n=1 Tax=Actinomadura kijaniata TaxID=46161 RepID=UPI00082DD437|nr:RRQRL motif-containing zinc-binding protein [Actinomadura kijaniata]